VMLHSGSWAIGQHFIQLTRRDMAGHMDNMPVKDLAYFFLGNPHFADSIEVIGLRSMLV